MRKRVRLYDEDLPEPTPSRSASRDYTVRLATLSRIEREFVRLFVAGYDREKAAVLAGYKPSSAYLTASRLLADPRIRRYRAELEAESLRRQNLDIDHFLRLRYLTATTPLTEIGEYYTPPCRHCWGTNHEHQRTFDEMEEDLRNYQQNLPDRDRPRRRTRESAPFDPRGGDGYHHRLPINPECPACLGRGDERNKIFVLKDWDDLSPAGRTLISAVKFRKDGTLEVSTDRAAASADIAGMIKTLLEPTTTPDAERVFALRRAVGDGARMRITRIERIVVDPVPVTIDQAAD